MVFTKNNTYQNTSKCDVNVDKTNVKSLARRLTSDMYPNIMNNAYFKPSYKTPYYFISKLDVISDSLEEELSNNTILEQMFDPCGYIPEEKIDDELKLEIRCGSNIKYKPDYVYIDYIRIPEKIELSYSDLESEIDNSKILEFPEYVCYELVNECVKLIMENVSDPRLETNTAINQTIGTNVSQNK